jgi:hypothetical protein
MALVLLDRAKETTVVVGTTASAILLGAAPGYQSFAGVGNGNTTYYCIADQSGGLNWEVGLGTYTLATTTITRAATPLSSSNAGASVSFPAGTKDIFIVYPSSKGVWLDTSGNAIGLGTPAAFVATNVTGLPLTTGVTGTLPATNGGTGVAGTLTGILYGNGTSAHSVTTTAQMLTGMGVANTTTSGYLSSTDWNTFNGKQAAGSYVTVGGALGTPSSGTLTNCTFPTLNQNTTGSSGSCTGNAATATNATNATNYVGGTGYTVGNTAAFASANDTTLSVRGTSTTAATMSFHRPGAYAANFGIDTDNVLKYGGWSAGTVYPVYHGGNPPTALSGSAFSAAANGYYKVASSGMVIQWGTMSGTGTHTTSYSFTFPLTFPTACQSIAATTQQGVSVGVTSVYLPITALSTTGATVQYGSINGASYTYSYRWIAIGY